MTQSKVELVSLGGHARLLRDGYLLDVRKRSGGRFTDNTNALLANWAPFCDWARGQEPLGGEPLCDRATMGPCVPAPRQIFAIGLNYRAHAAEAGIDLPAEPMVFTKFPSCLAGPGAHIELTGDTVDWEVELVVVIGAGGRNITADRAMSRVAGYCVGQDISDRRRQFGDRPPQFSLGKSARGFGPIGPAVVSLDSIQTPDDLALSCEIDGVQQQSSRTSDMVFGVAELVSYLSRYCELLPGDLIFTGTPSGVGSVQDPRRYLKPGETIVSRIEGLGELHNRCVAPAEPAAGAEA